jgi:hypothetical protein
MLCRNTLIIHILFCISAVFAGPCFNNSSSYMSADPLLVDISTHVVFGIGNDSVIVVGMDVVEFGK